MGINLGVHPACKPKNIIVEGPYFESVSTSFYFDVPLVYKLFGKFDYQLNTHPPDWFYNYVDMKKINVSDIPWWQIDDFDPDHGDIKNFWELSRFSWAPFLAFSILEDNSKIVILNHWIESWVQANKEGFGIHWKCAQECSFRILNLAITSLILGSEYKLTTGLKNFLITHLNRIDKSTHYAVAQQNNHATSEAAALIIGGSWLSLNKIPNGKQYYAKGLKLLEKACKKLITNEGLFSQSSSNYHRLVLDTFTLIDAWRQVHDLPMLSQTFYRKFEKLFRVFFMITEEGTGNFPFFGANDGANLFSFTHYDYKSAKPSIFLAENILFEEPLLKAHCPYLKYFGSKFYNKPKNFKNSFTPSQIIQCNQSGFNIIKYYENLLIFRRPIFKFRPSQNDCMHIEFWNNSRNILRDAGSFSYNNKFDLIEQFDSSIGHNTVIFDGRDSMNRISRFLYSNWPKEINCIDLHKDGEDYVMGSTVKYLNKYFHSRKIKLSEDHLCIDDKISGFDHHALMQLRLENNSWQLEQSSDYGIIISSKESKIIFNIETNVPIASANIIQLPESCYYNSFNFAPVFQMTVNQSGVIKTTLSY